MIQVQSDIAPRDGPNGSTGASLEFGTKVGPTKQGDRQSGERYLRKASRREVGALGGTRFERKYGSQLYETVEVRTCG